LLDHGRDARDRGVDNLGGERGGLGGLERREDWSGYRRHGDVDNEGVELPEPWRLMLNERGRKSGDRGLTDTSAGKSIVP